MYAGIKFAIMGVHNTRLDRGVLALALAKPVYDHPLSWANKGGDLRRPLNSCNYSSHQSTIKMLLMEGSSQKPNRY